MGKKQKSRKKKEKSTEASSFLPDTITILIHGTYSRRIGFWHRPGSPLHRHIRNQVFPCTYSGGDYFRWSGLRGYDEHSNAADELIQWCNNHPARSYNLISHSHGTNVANIASNRGLKINRLVHLAPAVWTHHPEYLPNMDAVQHPVLFNFHADRDIVITHYTDPPAMQNYQETAVADFELEIPIAPRGHWAPVRLYNWLEDDIGDIISSDFVG